VQEQALLLTRRSWFNLGEIRHPHGPTASIFYFLRVTFVLVVEYFVVLKAFEKREIVQHRSDVAKDLMLHKAFEQYAIFVRLAYSLAISSSLSSRRQRHKSVQNFLPRGSVLGMDSAPRVGSPDRSPGMT
jgi:hypothetical protein